MKCRTCGGMAGGMAIPLGVKNPTRWAFDCTNCGDHWTATMREETVQEATPPIDLLERWWQFWNGAMR